MKYCFLAACLFVPACLVLAQGVAPLPPKAAPDAVSADTVILTVGDEKITKSQFELIIATLPDQQRAQLAAPGGKRKLAESLAELKSLAQEGRARKIDQTPKLQMQMKLQAEQTIAQNMFQDLANSTKPDEAAVRAYYEAHKAEWEEVTAKHILIRYQGSTVPIRPGQKDLSEPDALVKAKDVRAKILAGAKFDDLAAAESDDTGNAPHGGELGAFTKGKMVPQFEQAAFAAEIGKITEPVKTQFGYHLILVTAHSNKTFEQVRPEIEGKMKPEMGQKALADLKAKKNIVYDDAYFGK